MIVESTPENVRFSGQLGLLQITRHDHPEPPPMAWSDIELQAIREYAGRCVARDRNRVSALVEAVRDANCDAEDEATFRLLTPGQERAWLALLAGLK